MVLKTAKLRYLLIALLIRQGITSFVNRTKFVTSSQGYVYTSTHSIEIMTSYPSVPAVERQTMAGAMTVVTPLAELLIATRDRSLETFTISVVSNENVSESAHSKGPVKTFIARTTSQLVSHMRVNMTYPKLEHKPAHPSNKPNTTTRDYHVVQKDKDWQVSVIVVSVLLVGMIVFVAIMFRRGNYRNRLARNRKQKVTFAATVPLITVSADRT